MSIVSCSGGTFVVRYQYACRFGEKWPDQVEALTRMIPHLGEFFVSEASWLGNDPMWDENLSHVVEECRLDHGGGLTDIPAEVVRGKGSTSRDTPGMIEGIPIIEEENPQELPHLG